ncbi:MAG: WD40/YVTN/BNR-like repeat-containing protein, partial [Bryobacteraceae bacterium]
MILALVALLAVERFTIQYFHDQDRSSLTLVDLKFPSPRRGVAVGFVQEEGRDPKPVALVTSDGGGAWSLVPLKDDPVSLFFLSESLGWMVTPKAIWRTEETGRSWTRIKAPAGLLRVHFRDPLRGWAVGFRKQVYQTSDGG